MSSFDPTGPSHLEKQSSHPPKKFGAAGGAKAPHKVWNPAPSSDFSQILIYTPYKDNGLYVKAQFNAADPIITGGGGGWVSIQRPRKNPISVWQGPTEGYTMQINLLLDAYGHGALHGADGKDDDVDIEEDCRILEKMSGQQLVGGPPTPPLLVINANGALQNDVIHQPALNWVIPEPIDWGPVLRNHLGRRIRQEFTVKFMRYTAYDQLSRELGSKPTSSHRTKARAGDTYKKIAARELKHEGGARWANRLAQLNGARDGASKPRPGQYVKLPTADQIKQWRRTPRR